MAQDFVRNLEAEIAALEADLNADPRWQKLNKLRDLLGLYTEGVAAQHVTATLPSASHTPYVQHTPGHRRPSSNRLMAEELSEEFLRGRHEPTPTRDIYSFLLSRGVEIGGKQPTSNLAAVLSKNHHFKSIGRQGWVLTVQDESGAEQTSVSSSEEEGDELGASEILDLDH